MLRRTAFRRKDPPPSLARVRQWSGPAPTPREPPRAVLTAPRAFSPQPKEEPLQHLGYMNLVRSQACSHCFKPPRSVFCHADEGKGTGIKTDCRRGWPGCNACHYLIGSTGTLGKAERRRIEELYGARARAKIIADGTWPKRLPRWPADSTTA